MKSFTKPLSFLLVLIMFSSASCLKDKKLDSNGLPPATQEGKNTLGFLLNGKPWTPKGFNGTANLSMEYDAGYRNGVFGIAAYCKYNNMIEQFTIGVRDSLNYLNVPISVPLSSNTLLAMSLTNDSCDFFTRDGSTLSSGNLTITKLDATPERVIISGKFHATLHKPGCDTIHITEGRFDMSLH